MTAAASSAVDRTGAAKPAVPAFATGRAAALPVWKMPATMAPPMRPTHGCCVIHGELSRFAAAAVPAKTTAPEAGRTIVPSASLTLSKAGILSTMISPTSRIDAMTIDGVLSPNDTLARAIITSVKQAGKNIPRDSYGQLGGGRAVSYSDAKPGDVMIFNGGGHAGIYVGNGQFVHSSNYGTPVKRDAVKEWTLTGIRRY